MTTDSHLSGPRRLAPAMAHQTASRGLIARGRLKNGSDPPAGQIDMRAFSFQNVSMTANALRLGTPFRPGLS